MNVDLFVQNVKQLCAERGISPTAACKESGVGTSFIPDIKRGRIPSIDKFEKLALYLGVTISQLIGDARNSLVVMQYSVPPKDTIEEVYEILDMIQPKLIHDFKSYINSTDPPFLQVAKAHTQLSLRRSSRILIKLIRLRKRDFLTPPHFPLMNFL